MVARIFIFILISYIGWLFFMCLWRFIDSLIKHDLNKAMLPAAIMSILIVVVVSAIVDSKKNN